jgi:hypothetical protein
VGETEGSTVGVDPGFGAGAEAGAGSASGATGVPVTPVDEGDESTSFIAFNVTVYVVPLVRPDTTNGEDVTT